MSGLCGRNCNSCIFKEYFCEGCSLCEVCMCDKNCRDCFALCPERPAGIAYLMSVGGPEIESKGNKKIHLPAHIPILPDVFKEKPRGDIMPVIGLHAGSMFSRNGEKINPKYLNNGYVKALNIAEGTEAVLEFYVKDRTLEGFWDNRKNNYKDLKRMNIKAIISPNFSVYEDAPRLVHLYNIKRTTIVYNEMLEAGLNAIPDVSWYSLKDLDKWIREIKRNKVKMIAFSFQVVDVRLKASNIWKNYLTGFRYLCKNIDPEIEILIIGITSSRRVKEIHAVAFGHRIIVLNQSAFVQSRRGMLFEGRNKNTEFTKDDIFHRNIMYFNKLYEDMNLKHNLGGEKNA
ncbi:hypothetical protein L21TH_0505 [Caldisalinibacter kiritimatiensis]|uniref:Uncharacterized protein n=2 Tax=Caldisalinibacter kiritimatiensis TaxID=1304284 RepID=R1AWC4_9FIRM|nr:hypothetical protein L21TH_0505 [Caldisalinibacter kiritimatiensis]